MSQAELSPDGQTLTVTVPLAIRTRGGRKQVVAPAGATLQNQSWAPPKPRIDSTLVKALARAFRWRRLLDDGVYATIEELAAAEKINVSYVSRVLRLTLLSPALVAAILDGRQPPELTLARLFRPLPVEWGEQKDGLT
jgi:hypothetical protein